MIQKLVIYPEKPSVEFNAPVRFFDDELKELLQDLKDTMMDNNLKGLSAYQINNPYSVVVIKRDDSFIELINPRIFKSSDKITTKETTTYFENIEVEITRDKNITVAYDDVDSKQCYIDFSEEEAVLVQRKIDYTFGANFYQRLNTQQQEQLEQNLSSGIDVVINNSCPVVFKRDKILKAINILLAVTLIFTIFSLFTQYLVYSFSTILILIVSYFFYAQYEGKQYTNCGSCQLGNIVGTSLFHLVKLAIVFGIYKFI